MNLEGWRWWVVSGVVGLLLGLLFAAMAQWCGIDPETLPSPVNYP